MFWSKKAINLIGNEIYINSELISDIYDKDNDYVIRIDKDILELKVYIDKKLKQIYHVDKVNENEVFNKKYFHIRIIIRENHALMIDGILSNKNTIDENNSENIQIRFHPLFISNEYFDPSQLKGKGLFHRGLHFPGYVTSSETRLVCICDECNKSFTIQSFHTGFSELNYFYSDDGLDTLTLSSREYQGLPGTTTKVIDYEKIWEIESVLPKLSDGQTFKYFNSFSCPHCLSPYIDFRKYPEDRQYEYYGNVHVGRKSIKYSRK